MQVVDVKKTEGNAAMLASFRIRFDSGLILNKLRLMVTDGRRWISFPAEKYTNNEGKASYSNYFHFEDKDRKNAFDKHFIPAVEKLLCNAPDDESTKPFVEDKEIPF